MLEVFFYWVVAEHGKTVAGPAANLMSETVLELLDGGGAVETSYVVGAIEQMDRH